ncbi:phosphoribosylaminoimidazole-succinocarboxamide synthase PurC [Thermoclostridium stercorarium subsp. stercorarium DSM 8532]|uniref:Phosphoribosylaminoimidazole-succinocarboxamide synthase n=3 Tax=Thermoclostridium stercorarium TaxID=1510 RepID=L7VSS8_THES1|nr:phosphoribosylaminoimidazolesuccinocarboxamide synthase [Thermoclostridium stercorarium]AGC69436.1 phosphoribosylaminoimidazole-succinocarboxamide synthase PurC [Thermoclostridium stercorarium subsp. stercorarium DSM 8532]AGI40396.1 phosphoribosylaminoimidazole-succinocarboxamide synthase [Thermoclostridium stercorarium subsp. stercorarium DSM 8532]ANW99684.1 phosphoribosylaminoimidazolesuccinocarboxamide synthase [Thermoclostridium stercorarium subsp. thermolacticum DSM 2910]ANX02310.1 phos
MLLKNTDFIDLPVFARGKVRDVFEVDDETLLMVVTDRISAFDVVFNEPIPDKGKVLNKISEFWFEFTKGIIGNHVITTDVSKYPKGLDRFRDELEGRSMLVRKVRMENVECIVRGYLEGSGLKEYRAIGSVCGIKLPEGLKQADRLPEPIFTPSTKSKEGHDVNITFEDLVDMIGSERAKRLKEKSLEIYTAAAEYAESRGIIIADTKFEFGYLDGELVIADEILTPDSSRFWPLDDYEPGRPQKSFDKQFLREYLEGIGWDKEPPAPPLPAEIIEKTREKYIEAYERLTGNKFC